MKSFSHIRVFSVCLPAVMILVILGFWECERITAEQLLLIKTNIPNNFSHNSCTASGTIVDLGIDIVIQHGFCWSTSENPDFSDDTIRLGPGKETGAFSAVISSLEAGTEYYIRAFASTSATDAFGKTVLFTTAAPTDPSVRTDTVYLGLNDSFYIAGSILDDGGSEIIQKGFCWDTLANPTLSGSFTNKGAGSDNFSDQIGGLPCNHTYYFRAYAINDAGPGYGNVFGLQTSHCPVGPPEVVLDSIRDLSVNSLYVHGAVIHDGGSVILDRGICWSTEEDPDLNDNVKSNGTGIGSFYSYIAGLECAQTYFVRAYATNTVGTDYSEQKSFTTADCPAIAPVVITSAISAITESSAIGGGEIVNDGGADILAKGICWSKIPDPSLSDNHTDDGGGTDSYISELNDLNCNSRYYVRAYATNSHSTSYGNLLDFVTSQCPPEPPTVISLTEGSVTANSAQCGGVVTDDGGAEVTDRGICWSEHPGPTTEDYSIHIGSGIGSFSGVIEGLAPFQVYYFRAFATNIADTNYGEQLSFTTLWDQSVVTDYDGNVYNTIQIGNQVWIQENLNSTHYADGGPIEEINEGWDTLKLTDRAYCWYDDNGTTYGALYTWAAATGGQPGGAIPSGVQGICPSGWHIPSDSEWKQMEAELGMSQLELDNTGWRGTNQGTQLLAGGSSQFEALFGGFRYDTGSGMSPGSYAAFWTSTEFTSSRVFYRALSTSSEVLRDNDFPKDYGLSVRCIRD